MIVLAVVCWFIVAAGLIALAYDTVNWWRTRHTDDWTELEVWLDEDDPRRTWKRI